MPTEMPSASGLERAFACPASMVLPAVHRTSAHAERGTSLHAFVHAVLRGVPRSQALASVPEEWREAAAEIDVMRVGGDLREPRTEEAFGYNLETGEARAFGKIDHRAYPDLGEGWVYGTEDFGGVRIDGVPVTGDTKTGYLDVTPAKDNPQVKFHALVRMTLDGALEVDGRVVHKREGRKAYVDQTIFSSFELDSFADDLADLRKRIHVARAVVERGEVPTVTTGEHCRYCPAVDSCPANVALARTTIAPSDLDADSVKRHLSTLTPEQLGAAWRKAEALEDAAKLVKAGLKTIVKSGTPLPLEPGRRVHLNVVRQKRFDQDAAIEMLRAKGATDAEIDALRKPVVTEKVEEGRDPAALPAPKKGRAA